MPPGQTDPNPHDERCASRSLPRWSQHDQNIRRGNQDSSHTLPQDRSSKRCWLRQWRTVSAVAVSTFADHVHATTAVDEAQTGIRRGRWIATSLAPPTNPLWCYVGCVKTGRPESDSSSANHRGRSRCPRRGAPVRLSPLRGAVLLRLLSCQLLACVCKKATSHVHGPVLSCRESRFPGGEGRFTISADTPRRRRRGLGRHSEIFRQNESPAANAGLSFVLGVSLGRVTDTTVRIFGVGAFINRVSVRRNRSGSRE